MNEAMRRDLKRLFSNVYEDLELFDEIYNTDLVKILDVIVKLVLQQITPLLTQEKSKIDPKT